MKIWAAPLWAPLHLLLLPGVCSCVGSLWAAASFRACLPALEWGPPWAAVWISPPPWSSIGCRATNSFTMVFSMWYRGNSAPGPGAPPPAPPSLTSVCAGLLHVFSHSSLSQLFHSVFYCFLRMSSLMVSSLGPFWSWLELAVGPRGKHPTSSHRGHICSPPATKTLPH